MEGAWVLTSHRPTINIHLRLVGEQEINIYCVCAIITF